MGSFHQRSHEHLRPGATCARKVVKRKKQVFPASFHATSRGATSSNALDAVPPFSMLDSAMWSRLTDGIHRRHPEMFSIVEIDSNGVDRAPIRRQLGPLAWRAAAFARVIPDFRAQNSSWHPKSPEYHEI
jgi:hypothetical protein